MSEPIVRTALIMGAPVDDVTVDEAVDRIAAMIERGRSSGHVHQVATVNADFLVNAKLDREVLEILQRTDLAIPDGMPVVWASRLMGTPLRERTTGVDLVPALAARAAVAGYRMVLFGGAPGIAARAGDILRDRFPALAIGAIDAPSVRPDGSMDTAALAAIRAARPDVVCVALGNPKQERWIDRYRAAVGAPVFIGIGGTLDFLTGSTRRAPVWMQRSGLEWLHRAISEPQRLAGRYARDLVVFLPVVARQAWRGRRRAAAVLPELVLTPEGEARVKFLGPAPPSAPEAAVVALLQAGRELTIDLSALERLDNVTVAAVAGLARHGRFCGSKVLIEGLTASPGDPARDHQSYALNRRRFRGRAAK